MNVPHSALLLVVAGTALVPRAGAIGGDLVWTFQGIEDVICADEIRDVNADGVPDLVVETYDAGATGDHLYCLSGGAPGPISETIWSVRPLGGPSNSGGYGDECVKVVPDFNGDDRPDVLLGTAWGARTAFVLDGTDGSDIWSFDTYSDQPPTPPESGWVYGMEWVPDTDGDGVPDVFFHCGSDNDRAYHLSGAAGTLLWSVPLGDGILASVTLGDVDGDQKGDVAFGVGDFGNAVWVMRGGTSGNPIQWSLPMPGSVLALARLEDISGDGVNEVVVGTWDYSIFAFNGATGGTLWESSPVALAAVMRIETLDDVNGDGIQDLVVGSWADAPFVLSGLDGSLVWQKPVGGDVWAVDRVGDVTGDGINDVVAGSFDDFVYVLDGTDGTEQWKFNTGNRLYWVMGTSDLTGNGVPDVFAGSQKLSGPGGQGFLLEGGVPGAVSADLPMFVEARPAMGGVEVRLNGARGVQTCWVERLAGSAAAAPAAVRYEREILRAVRAREISVEEAIASRSGDPHRRWQRVSAAGLPVEGKRATWLDSDVEPGRTYSYRFALLNEGVVVGYSPTATVTAVGDVASDLVPEIRARPNPVARAGVTIEFELPRPIDYRLSLHDAGGRRVAVLEEGRAGGLVRRAWEARGPDGRALPNGVYFLRLEGPDFVSSEKLTLLR